MFSIQQKWRSNEEKSITMSDLRKFNHGQEAVEREFSANKELLVENQKKESLIAQRLVKDYTSACCNGDLSKFPVPKRLILSARNSASRYEAKRANADKQAQESKAKIERKRKTAVLRDKLKE